MFFIILSAVAQFECERIAEIIAEAKSLAKSQNRYTGGVIPFGFDVIENEGKKFLKKNEAQTAAITEILKLREDGLSYKRIAKAVNHKHKMTLSHMGVKRVLIRYPEKS